MLQMECDVWCERLLKRKKQQKSPVQVRQGKGKNNWSEDAFQAQQCVTHRVSGKGISLSEPSPFFSLPVSQWSAFTRKPAAPASSTFLHLLYYTSGLKRSSKVTEVLSSLAVASSVWYQQTPVVERVCAGEGNVSLYRNTMRCGTKVLLGLVARVQLWGFGWT